jgi:NADH-quinone oxidoreductase subunit M
MLTLIVFLPLGVALLGCLLPARVSGWWAFLGTLVSLGLAIALVAGFDASSGELQETVSHSWTPDLGVSYMLGVDGLSLFLVLLTSLLWSAATLYSALQIPDRARTYFFMLGLGQMATLGAFLAQDLLLFVLFFDLMLIPFYFLVGGWGTGDRIRATIKMIVFTFSGSLLMLAAAIATAMLSADANGGITFSIQALAQTPLGTGSQYWIFCFFALAFLIKMPAFLGHGWMPDAYRSCPLPVLVLLSGVLAKVGAYGFLRVVMPLFPDAAVHFQDVLLIIALASIVYGSAMAFTQTNLRLIAGYSSMAQMGFITLGIFSLASDGGDGAVIQMVNHGLVVAPVFFIIAFLAERTGTEDVREMGGLAKRAPVFAILFMIVTLALLAMPGSANFVGEFYILSGVFHSKVAIALIGSSGIALAAFYALRMYQRTMHNRLPDGLTSREITLREAVVLVPLVMTIVALALYPALITERGEASVDRSLSALCTGTPDAPDCPAGVNAPEQFGEAPGWTGYAPVAEVGK